MLFDHPRCWLAIRSHNPTAVKSALGLHHAQPCGWFEGLARVNEQMLFISPPCEGWVLVFGAGLPDAATDVDVCFRFLLDLSRKLGQVQFFAAHPAVGHHAWALLDRGQVVRAYAWAEETLWNQGPRTSAERELGIRCFEYGGDGGQAGSRETARANCEKVPALAARWSLDPKAVDVRNLRQKTGIAGERFFSRPH
jgi:hypothetical protein